MKKLMVALLLLVAVSSIASAEPFIGMFTDDQAVVCHSPFELYVQNSVYFFALLTDVNAISAAEFRVEGLPGPADAITTPMWNTDLVIGDLGYGIALAFSPVVPGPNAFLGQVDFFGLVDLPADHVMMVMASNDSGNLVVVDENFDTIPALGGIFTFNCGTGDCLCTEGTATEDATMSSIKALY